MGRLKRTRGAGRSALRWAGVGGHSRTQGTIGALNGGTLSLGGNWVNDSTISVTGGTLSLGGTSNVLGTFSVTEGSTLDVVGGFTTAQLSSITYDSSSSVEIGPGGTLENEGATLWLNSSTASWSLTGGTIQGGVVSGAGGAELVCGSGTLDGVTLACDLDLENGWVDIVDGLTLEDATVWLGGASYWGTSMNFDGTQTLGGTGEVVFGGEYRGPNSLSANDTSGAATLTIGAGIEIDGLDGTVSAGSGDTSIVNYGTIEADTGGGTIGIALGGSGGTFTNQGTLGALNGGTLSLGGSWVNDSTISVTGGTLSLGGTSNVLGTFSVTEGSTLDVVGGFTTAQLSSITYDSSSSVEIGPGGTLENEGATLWLNSSTASWSLTGGTIQGGVVSGAGGAELVCGSGTLDGVTLACDLDVENGWVDIVDGLTLEDATVWLGGASYWGTSMNFGGTQTLGGTGEVVFGGEYRGPNTLSANDTSGAATLTIGAGIEIDGLDGNVSAGSSDATIVSEGTIQADTAGGTISAGGTGTFTNQGTIGAENGGTLNLSGLTGNLGAVVLSGPGSQVTLSGTGYVNNQGLTAPEGTTLTLNGTWSNVSTVEADSASGTVNIGGSGTFTNEGTIRALNGGTLNVSTLTGDVGTVVLVGSGSQVTLSGTNLVNNLGLTAPAGTTLSVSGLTGDLGTVLLDGPGSQMTLSGTGYVNNLGLTAPGGRR